MALRAGVCCVQEEGKLLEFIVNAESWVELQQLLHQHPSTISPATAAAMIIRVSQVCACVHHVHSHLHQQLPLYHHVYAHCSVSSRFRMLLCILQPDHITHGGRSSADAANVHATGARGLAVREASKTTSIPSRSGMADWQQPGKNRIERRQPSCRCTRGQGQRQPKLRKCSWRPVSVGSKWRLGRRGLCADRGARGAGSSAGVESGPPLPRALIPGAGDAAGKRLAPAAVCGDSARCWCSAAGA
jgi:hypothetical protein